MIKTITKSQFVHEFEECNRENQFSYTGREALYDYLVEIEEECVTSIELDVIAICCDFTEYEDIEELLQNYTDIESTEDLEDHTVIIRIERSDGFIIQNF